MATLIPGELNRIPPHMEPQAYRTYRVSAPLRTHWRPADCDEYECDAYLHGFVLTVDLSTELGQRQAHYVRHDRSRRCHEQRIDLTTTKFVYGPGNRCFSYSEHRVPIGKPARLLVVGGDWRGNPLGFRRVHTKVEHWVEDLALNQNWLAERAQRG